MAATKPKPNQRFYYLPEMDEQRSSFQEEAFRALNWEGLHLVHFQETDCRGYYHYPLRGYLPLSHCDHGKLSPDFLLHLILHLGEVWAAIEGTHLLADNLCFDPDALLFPEEEFQQSKDVKTVELLYLPIWRKSPGEMLDDPDGRPAFAAAQSGRLGLIQLYLESSEGKDLPPSTRQALVEAASKGMVELQKLCHMLLAEEAGQASSISPSFQQPALPKPQEQKELLGEEFHEKINQRYGYSTRQKSKLRLPYGLFSAQLLYTVSLVLLPQYWPQYFHTRLQKLSILFFLVAALGDILQILPSHHRKQKQPALICPSQQGERLQGKVARHWKRAKRNVPAPQRKNNPPQNEERSSQGQFPPCRPRFETPAFLSRKIPGSLEEQRSDRAYILHDRFLLGTDPRVMDLTLPGPFQAQAIAEIERKNNAYYLSAKSRTRVSVNGKRIKRNQSYRLEGKSTLRMGDTVYYFCDAESLGKDRKS